jgi:hypothetical protein
MVQVTQLLVVLPSQSVKVIYDNIHQKKEALALQWASPTGSTPAALQLSYVLSVPRAFTSSPSFHH